MKRTLFKLEPMMRKRRQHLSERKISVRCFVFGQPQSRETIMLKLANANVGFFLRVKSQFRFRSVSQKNNYQRCISLFWQVFSDKPSLYKHDLSCHCDEDKFILFAWVFDDTGWHFPVVNRLSVAIFLIMLSKLILKKRFCLK